MSTTLEQLSERPIITTLRQKIGWLCQLIRWLIVAYTVWILYRVLEPILIHGAAESALGWSRSWGLPDGSFTTGEMYLSRGIAMVSWFALVNLCLAVWKLISNYLQGDIFSTRAANQLRWVGIAGLIATLVDIVVRPIMLGILSTEIFKIASYQTWIDPVDLMYFLIALFVLSLGHIQKTAAEISEEHQQFV